MPIYRSNIGFTCGAPTRLSLVEEFLHYTWPALLSRAALLAENEALNSVMILRVMLGCTGEAHDLSVNLKRRVLAVDNGGLPIDANTTAADLCLRRPGRNRCAEKKTDYYSE